MLQSWWYSASSHSVLYCQNLSSCVLFVCFCLFMLMCSHSIPPVQTFALNSRFSSHQCNKYLYLALHISNLTYPKWKNSVSLLILFCHNQLPSYSSQKSGSHSYFFPFVFLPFPVHQEALSVIFPQYTPRILPLLNPLPAPLPRLQYPRSWRPPPPHFPACLAAETGWGGGRGEEKWPEATTDQWEEDRHPNRKMGQVLRRFTEEETQMPFKLVKDVHVWIREI